MARVDPKERVQEAAREVTTLTVDGSYQQWAEAGYPNAHNPVDRS